MTNEDRLRDRLKALDHVGPSSGLLERARHSGPRQPAAGPSVTRRLIVIATAFAVFGASAVLVWRALDPTGTHGTARSTLGQRHQPPDWVVRAAIQTATNNQDSNPTSAYWILADSNIVSAAVDPSAATGGSRGQEYLVVLYGSFTDTHAFGLGAPPTGSVIAFAMDPKSHVVTDFGLTSRPVRLAGLQAFSLTPSDTIEYVNQVGLPLSVSYPGGWFAQSIARPADAVGPHQLGVIVANTSSGMPSSNTASPTPGPLPENPTLPPDFVRLTILTNGDGQPDPAAVDSPLPLSMNDAKHAPGPVNIRSISATVSGIRYEISIQGGPQASAADLATADQVVSSINPTETSPSPGTSSGIVPTNITPAQVPGSISYPPILFPQVRDALSARHIVITSMKKTSNVVTPRITEAEALQRVLGPEADRYPEASATLVSFTDTVMHPVGSSGESGLTYDHTLVWLVVSPNGSWNVAGSFTASIQGPFLGAGVDFVDPSSGKNLLSTAVLTSATQTGVLGDGAIPVWRLTHDVNFGQFVRLFVPARSEQPASDASTILAKALGWYRPPTGAHLSLEFGDYQDVREMGPLGPRPVWVLDVTGLCLTANSTSGPCAPEEVLILDAGSGHLLAALGLKP